MLVAMVFVGFGNVLVIQGLRACCLSLEIFAVILCWGVWHMVLFWGAIAALPALIHARLYGCTGSFCPEKNHTARGVNRMVCHDSIQYRFSYLAIRYLPIPQKIL